MAAITTGEAAGGDAQRDTAGLIRRVTLWGGENNQLLDRAEFTSLAQQTEDDFGHKFTTTRRVGPITILHDTDRNYTGLVDNINNDLQFTLDNSSAVQQGTTAITPATGDRFDLIFLALKANGPLRTALGAMGISA